MDINRIYNRIQRNNKSNDKIKHNNSLLIRNKNFEELTEEELSKLTKEQRQKYYENYLSLNNLPISQSSVSSSGSRRTTTQTQTLIDANRFYSYAVEEILDLEPVSRFETVTHSSLVSFETPYHGFKYYNFYTPYPREFDENPHLVASNDMQEWTAPAGITNPVIPPPDPSPSNPDAPNEYNSDTHLVYDPENDKFIGVWFESDFTTRVAMYVEITWNGTQFDVGSPSVFFTTKEGDASPSLVLRNDMWEMTYVHVNSDPDPDLYTFRYREAESISGLQSAEEIICDIGDVPSGKHIWHAFVFYDEILENYIGLFNYTNDGVPPNNGGVLRFATSLDSQTWVPMDENSTFEQLINLYRSSVIRTTYSAENGLVYEGILNPQWDARKIQVHLIEEPSNQRVGAFDNVSNISGQFELSHFRHKEWTNQPTGRIGLESYGNIIGTGNGLTTSVGNGALGETNIAVQTLRITDGNGQILLDNGDGLLVGDGTASIDYETGTVSNMVWDTAPPNASPITADFVHTFREVFPTDDGDLQLFDGTSIETWASGTNMRLLRLYNSVLDGNYARFYTPPLLVKNPWEGNTKWGWQFDSTEENYGVTFDGLDIAQVTLSGKLVDGRTLGILNNADYFAPTVGANSYNLAVQSSGTIAGPHLNRPAAYTGRFGDGFVRRNKEELASGSIGTITSNQKAMIGASQPSGQSIQQFFEGTLCAMTLFGSNPSTEDMELVEDQYISDYPYINSSGKLIDGFTAPNGTNIRDHVPDISPTGNPTYSANDGNTEISNNGAVRTSSGTGIVFIDVGWDEGYTEAIITSGASTKFDGVIWAYEDENNYIYTRLLNNNAFQTIEILGGTLSLIAGLDGSLNPVAGDTHKLGIWKQKKPDGTLIIRIYVDDILRRTRDYTESTFFDTTNVGFLFANQNTVFEHFYAEPL